MEELWGFAKHGLSSLVKAIGNEQNVVSVISTLVVTSSKLPKSGPFRIIVPVMGNAVEVTGTIINGEVKISNFWIP